MPAGLFGACFQCGHNRQFSETCNFILCRPSRHKVKDTEVPTPFKFREQRFPHSTLKETEVPNYGIVLFAGGWFLAQWRTASGLNKRVWVHGWPRTMAHQDIGGDGIVGTPGVPMTAPTPVGCRLLQQPSSRAAFKLLPIFKSTKIAAEHRQRGQSDKKMDTPMTPEEAVACFERLKDEDPEGEEVAAELNELLRFHGWVRDPFQQPYIPQPTVYQAAAHYPIAQLPTVQQPTVPHPTLPHPTLPHPTLPHPTLPHPNLPQPTTQQSAVQQSGGSGRSCPVRDCNSLTRNTRLDHLRDHLAEAHGYERAANEYTVAPHHLKRKTIAVLRLLFVRDVRKLAWNQARMRALEEAINQRDQSYVSCHGFRRDMPHSIAQANASKKQNLITLLTNVRDDFNAKGKLYNQSGNADSTWDEVYENLMSTFQIDGSTKTALERQAEQYFDNARTAMGDNTTQAVSPAQVLRTDELVLKQNASLPSK